MDQVRLCADPVFPDDIPLLPHTTAWHTRSLFSMLCITWLTWDVFCFQLCIFSVYLSDTHPPPSPSPAFWFSFWVSFLHLGLLFLPLHFCFVFNFDLIFGSKWRVCNILFSGCLFCLFITVSSHVYSSSQVGYLLFVGISTISTLAMPHPPHTFLVYACMWTHICLLLLIINYYWEVGTCSFFLVPACAAPQTPAVLLPYHHHTTTPATYHLPILLLHTHCTVLFLLAPRLILCFGERNRIQHGVLCSVVCSCLLLIGWIVCLISFIHDSSTRICVPIRYTFW